MITFNRGTTITKSNACTCDVPLLHATSICHLIILYFYTIFFSKIKYFSPTEALSGKKTGSAGSAGAPRRAAETRSIKYIYTPWKFKFCIELEIVKWKRLNWLNIIHCIDNMQTSQTRFLITEIGLPKTKEQINEFNEKYY